VALGFGMLAPILPRYARSFEVTLAAIGLVYLVFGITRFAFGLVGGLVVDRFGDRACTMAGLLIVSASSYAAGFAVNFPQLVIARGLGGAGSAFFIAGLQNRILRIIEPEAMGRATGAFRSSFLVGIGAGPVMGGVIAERFGGALVFHIYATGLIVATVIAWRVMRGGERVEAAARRSPLEALAAARPLFHDKRYVTALLTTFVAWWTTAGPAQAVGVVFAEEQLGLSPSEIGVAITLVAVGEIAILFVAGRASDRYGRRTVLLPSLVLTGLATIAIGQIESMPWAFFPLMVVLGASLAAGSTASGGLMADAIPREGSGAAVGVSQMAGDLGFLTSPTVVGAIAGGPGYGFAYVAAALPAFAVLPFAIKLPKPRRATDPDMHVEPATPVG